MNPAVFRATFKSVDTLGGKQVVILDDDAAQREVVAEVLELEGAVVRQASTAEEAERLLGGHPDVVLLDLHGVDAERLSATVLGRPDRPALLVVSGDTQLAEHAERLAVDGHLSKPYDLDELLAAIHAVLERRGARDAGAHP